jgi:hypothetical protein
MPAKYSNLRLFLRDSSGRGAAAFVDLSSIGFVAVTPGGGGPRPGIDPAPALDRKSLNYKVLAQLATHFWVCRLLLFAPEPAAWDRH